MEQTFLLGLAQVRLINGNVTENLEKIKGTVEKAKEVNPSLKIIVFPELTTTGYYLDSQIEKLAEAKDGYSFEFLAKVAKENNVHIVYGYVEDGGGEGRIYNSVQLIDDRGVSLANYRKIHTTNLEVGIFDAGNETSIVQTNLGKIGLMICWDIAFPELARMLALQGADIIIAPSAWEKPFIDPFIKFGSARSIDNTLFLATCNQIGNSEQLSFFGKSSVYGPDGNVITQAYGENEEVVFAQINLGVRKEMKENFFSMMDERRKDIY